MLRHIKHEYRKNLVLYIILAGILVGTQLFTMLSILVENETMLTFAVLILMEGVWALILFFMIMSIINYARELGSKASYLSFMTPHSSFTILGARYLSMLITTGAATVVFVLFVILDFNLIVAKFEDVSNFYELFNLFMEMSGYSEVITAAISVLLVVWMFIITAICIVYFSITLSHTILENARGKGGLTVAFTFAISAAMIFILTKMPTLDLGDGGIFIILNVWPSALFLLTLAAGSYVGSSLLLEKRLSL